MMNRILEASMFACHAHKGQYRKYGGRIPFITHPARVAARVMCVDNCTPDLVAVAWLHDVVEDCGVSLNRLERLFGTYVSYGVSCLTNKSKQYPQLSRTERKEIDRTFLKTIPRDFKLVKLIDRIDNLRDMHKATYGFKRLYAAESELLVREAGLSGLDEDLDNEYNHAITSLKESLC